MRWRVLSLAADFDRIRRSPDGAKVMQDQRIARLFEAMSMLRDAEGNAAEKVQMIFSDKTPPPGRA